MKFFIALIEYFIHIYEQVEMKEKRKIYMNQIMKDEMKAKKKKHKEKNDENLLSSCRILN